MNKERKRYMKIAVNLVWAMIVLAVVILVVPRIIVFFMPFIIGWIIALIANPLVKFLEEKLKIRRKAVSVLVIILVIAGVIGAGYLIIAKLVTESVGFINDLPNLVKSLEGDMTVIMQKLNGIYDKMPENMQNNLLLIGDSLSNLGKDLMGNFGTPTVVAVGTFAKNVPSIVIGIVMCILSAYFFTAEKDYVTIQCRRFIPRSLMEKWDILYRSLKTAVGGYIKAQFKIEIWIYLLLFIGLMILNLKYAALIALGVAILDILPFFGTGLVMLPWAIVKFLSADYKMAIGLLIIWGISQLVRQVIQPKIVGDSIGMSAIPTLFLLYIGYKVAGVIGMIIAVPIGIIIYNMHEAGIFDTTRTSLLLFVKSINDFRKYDKDDMDYLESSKDDTDHKNKI
ncbi:MAG: sporulation integral membrane protein YtvI [Lachnospiraceae bacterium]|nr:sporulation integral membrane protein YtvI [Lachnospiraceae bacterium]